MDLTTRDDGVVFVCPIDGQTVEGTPQDLRLGGGGGDQAAWVAELHSSTLQHAGRDPATKRVAKPCPDCSLPYLRQVVLGSADRVVWYLCDCGFRTPSADYDESSSSADALEKLEAAGWAGDEAAGYDPAKYERAHAKYREEETKITDTVKAIARDLEESEGAAAPDGSESKGVEG